MRPLRTRVSADTIGVLDSAIKEVKARAVNASRVDWPLATAQALASVVDGNSKHDALPGVQLILRSLADKHSWATVLDDRGRLTVNGQSVEYEPPRLRMRRLENGHAVGWLTLPRLGAVAGHETQDYARAIQSALRDAFAAGACGYVIDLSGHTGGNMWPGLDGLGPLLGDQTLVGSFKPGAFAWRISKDEIAGRLGPGDAAASEVLWRADLPIAPVAVLVGPSTASSGEAIAVALSGRANTEFFGRRTRGLATSTQAIELGDGLIAFIVVAVMADRDGKTFPAGIAPKTEDADDERAVARALAWLSSMPSCAGALH
jgi:C-terminal processing protease CtpA/Prc